MPFKHYHGRTGVVFNVTKRAIGVTVNKECNGRILKKQLHIATPHLKPSKCQAQILSRRVENEAIKKAVREGAPRQNLKRQNAQPKLGYVFNNGGAVPTTIQPLPYVDLV